MIYLSICAFALALVAFVCVGVVWITSLRRTLVLESQRSTTDSYLMTLNGSLQKLEERVSKLSAAAPTTLAAQVVELSDAVARLAKTQQRFAGKYYAQGGPRERERDAAPTFNGVDDPELAAELALQTAPAVAPGRNG